MIVEGDDGKPITNNVIARGPIAQSEFLSNMGIEVRLANLLRQATTEEDAQSLISSFQRLVAPDEMGTTYKVIALQSLDSKSEWHPGFSRSD